MSFFKAYDLRGTFGVDFDLDLVFRVGRELPSVVGGPRWLVGRDCRETSAAVRDALVAGLRAAGAEVTDLGLATTPMVYFFTAEDAFDGSVMVTASHNPPGDNGLKVSRRGALPVGSADGLAEIERRLCAGNGGEGPARSAPPSEVLGEESLRRYVAWQREQAQRADFSGLRFAVDCSNGMASLLAREIFPEAILLNDTPDGRFPCHSPNPLKAEARESVVRLVRERGLDCGLVFDGDADRCVFVDERGAFVQPDYLIPVVAKATLGGRTGERIIHDVRTSRGAIENLRALGCTPVMVPVGHAFAKPALSRTGAVCGGELAGHYYFREFHNCDSGVLAAVRILGEIAAAKRRGVTFSEMMRPICGVYSNSGELNFRVADKDAAIARALACARRVLPPERSRSEMDGVRLEYDEGWVSLRKSNTENYLRLIAERKGDVGDWIEALKREIEG